MAPRVKFKNKINMPCVDKNGYVCIRSRLCMCVRVCVRVCVLCVCVRIYLYKYICVCVCIMSCNVHATVYGVFVPMFFLLSIVSFIDDGVYTLLRFMYERSIVRECDL